MRWMVGSHPTFIYVENHVHCLILLGIAHLHSLPTINPNSNYPIFIDEPLVVLSLSSLFEREIWTKRETWITNSVFTVCNPLLLSFIIEELALLLFMEKFGDKYTALGDVFHLADSSLLLKKFTLVSLMQTTNSVMECCQAAWNAGSSNHFGYKANSPTDAATYLEYPKGILFIFLDTYMGPNFMYFLREEETKELMLVMGQGKVSLLDVITWIKAITPKLFYMVVVHLSLFDLLAATNPFFHDFRTKMEAENNIPP
jgi:hypothetical protein